MRSSSSPTRRLLKWLPAPRLTARRFGRFGGDAGSAEHFLGCRGDGSAPPPYVQPAETDIAFLFFTSGYDWVAQGGGSQSQNDRAPPGVVVDPGRIAPRQP